MRVLFASPSFAPQLGGAETWTRAVFGAFRDRGHDVSVIARATLAVPDSHEVAGMAVERVTGGRLTFAQAVRHAAEECRSRSRAADCRQFRA